MLNFFHLMLLQLVHFAIVNFLSESNKTVLHSLKITYAANKICNLTTLPHCNTLVSWQPECPSRVENCHQLSTVMILVSQYIH